jgi:hypothetical protein
MNKILPVIYIASCLSLSLESRAQHDTSAHYKIIYPKYHFKSPTIDADSVCQYFKQIKIPPSLTFIDADGREGSYFITFEFFFNNVGAFVYNRSFTKAGPAITQMKREIINILKHSKWKVPKGAEYHTFVFSCDIEKDGLTNLLITCHDNLDEIELCK